MITRAVARHLFSFWLTCTRSWDLANRDRVIIGRELTRDHDVYKLGKVLEQLQTPLMNMLRILRNILNFH